MQQQATGLGSPECLRQAEARIVARLSERGTQTFFEIAIFVLELVPIRITQVKDLVNDMKYRRVLTFDLLPRTRVLQKTTVISLLKFIMP